MPNFWMKVSKNANSVRTPPNVVDFKVSLEMTRLDVKNYLEKIYKLPVVNVQTLITSGRTHWALPSQNTRDTVGLYKDEDTKYARVTFPADFVFEAPDVTKENEESQRKRAQTEIEQSRKVHRKEVGKHARLNRRGAPNFFGL